MNEKESILIAVSLMLLGAWLLAPLSLSAAPGDDHSHEEEDHHEHAGDQNENHSDGEHSYEVKLETHPEPGEIVPDDDMVELILNISDDGAPADDVELSYRVYAPPKAFWFGTDFPVVEGTQLLSGTVKPSGGQQVISAVLPIRGEYRVKTTVRGPDGTSHDEETFTVSENSQEVINLSIFLLVLFLLGGVGGYFLSDGSSFRSPQSWILVSAGLLGLALVANPTSVRAHGEGSWDPHELEEQVGAQILHEDAEISAELFPQPVKVGEKVDVTYRVHFDGSNADHNHHAHEESTDPGPEAFRTVSHFVHSEGGLEMVNQSSYFSGNQGQISVQLFDGAPHYLVTRFYRPTGRYAPSDEHSHGDGTDEHSESEEQDPKDHDQHDEGHREEVEEDSTEHEHGEETEDMPPWEAEMHYQLSEGDYEVTFEESGDPSMKWLLLRDSQNHPADEARERMGNCENVETGMTLQDHANCYNLDLNKDGTTYNLSISKGGDYRLYTQHLPREFDMKLTKNDQVVEPNRRFVPGKGEYLGQTVKWVEVQAIQPPFDSIFKAMVTLLFVVLLGFYVGWKGPEWIK